MELDAYEAIVIGIASRIYGSAFHEHHRSCSARAAVLIKQQNVKVDWGVRDNGMFCSLFVRQKANVGSLCGNVAHLISFCPLLANPKTHNHQFPRGNVTGRQTDFQGRSRVSVGQREVCNNYNSERGCRFLHSCLVCRSPHASVSCPNRPDGRNMSDRHRTKIPHNTTRSTQ